MKAPLLVAIALAVLIIVAGVFAPAMYSSARKTAEKAQEQAALAQRQLARYSLTLPSLDALADIAAIKEAKLDAAVEDAGQRLQEISSEYARLAREAQQRAEQHGLPISPVQPLTVNTAGVQRVLSAFQTALRDNEALLKAAIADAKAATGTDSSALGVPQALGMAEYVRAAGLLLEAHELRIRQADAQAHLLDVGSQWTLAQGYLDHFGGLDVGPMLARLRGDLEELSELREEAAADVATFSTQVAEREQVLSRVEQALRDASQSLLAVEDQGFAAGEDASFNAYRESYLKLSQKVREFREQEQELRCGGRRGAELVGEDLATAEIQGGERVIGLEELERRVATAQERAWRLDSANLSLEEHITYVTESGRRAQDEMARYQKRLAELDAAQKTIVEEIQELATDALNKETEALQAAEAAVRAFAQSQRAADAWMRAARDLQRDKDPNRKNERLLLVTRDPYLEQVPRSAEAAARVLAGRIHAQRVESSQRLIDDMQLFAEMNPEFEFDASTFQTHLEEAQAAGLSTLERARDIYSTISGKLENQPTAWVPLAALATVHHLMARIDETQAAIQATQAFEFIQRAVEKREQFPYAKPFVRFRDHLAGVSPAAEPEEEEEPFFLEEEGDEEEEEEEEEEEDFFLDDG